jgi:hypothetical protein
MRRLSSVLFLAAVAAPAAAEPTRLTLSPAALPGQSMKYRLLPDARDLQPGNAATLYYRTLAMFFENKNLLEDLHEDKWGKWLDGPLEDLQDKELAGKLARYNVFLHEAALAGRCRGCDWQLSGRTEGIGLLLPEVQGLRNLANVLAVQARSDVANGRPLAAIPTLQSGFALAHNLGEGPFVIRVYVGAAVANMMCGRVEELVQLPDAPNLYWALAALPRPFFDPRDAVRGEADVFEQSFPWLKRMEEGPMSVAQVQACMIKLKRFVKDFNIRTPDGADFMTSVLINARHGTAKRYLVDQGFAPEVVDDMPVVQAVTLMAFRQYREAHEEAAKWALVRYGFRTKGYQEARAKFKEACDQLDQLFFYRLLRSLAGDFGLEKLYAATGRVDRRLAALACVESIRQYTSAHDGKFPKSLADLTDAPPPPDPVTGRPFIYKLDGTTAYLQSPLDVDEKPDAPSVVDYELTIRR